MRERERGPVLGSEGQGEEEEEEGGIEGQFRRLERKTRAEVREGTKADGWGMGQLHQRERERERERDSLFP